MRKYQWVVLLVSILIVVGLSQSVIDLWSRRDIVTERKQKLQIVAEEHEQLEKKLNEVMTPEFVEKEAREKLGMAKEGETVVIIDTSKFPAVLHENENPGESEEPCWKQWWNMFF